jgi:non-specific serine/threonine protein kinase
VRWIAIAETMLGYAVLQHGDPARAERLILAGLEGHRAVGDLAFLIFGLEDLAEVRVAQAQPTRAARLLGATAALRGALGVQLAPANRRAVERIAATVRGQLGAPEYDWAWGAGYALRPEQALAEAMTPTAAAPLPAPLTPREAEVAGLLARGLADREIAAALAISARTVGVHVQHLIAKLAVRSRWQVAEWAAARGLDVPPVGGPQPAGSAPARPPYPPT